MGVDVVFKVGLIVVVTERAVTGNERGPLADLDADPGEGLPGELRVGPEAADVTAERNEEPIIQVGACAQTDDRVDPGAVVVARQARACSGCQFEFEPHRDEAESRLQIHG